MLLIGFGHKCRQGKNFVANYMKEQDNSIKLYAFADELKIYCKEHHDDLCYQWRMAMPLGTKLNPPKDDPIYGFTQILQYYGTDVARKQDPDTWVKALHQRLLVEKPQVALITDVRFLNEAEYIKEKGGYLVEVIRQNADGTQYIDAGRDPNHPSEVSLDDYKGYDFTIQVKDGDLADLRRKSIGVYNLVTNPEKYSINLEDVPVYEPTDDDYRYGFFVSEPEFNADSDGTGFKS